jgi:two-component system, NarL family, response regulator DegU
LQWQVAGIATTSQAYDRHRIHLMNETAASPAKILIVGVQGLVRVAITTALAQAPYLEIVGECTYDQEAREILELCRTLQPDLVLMGLNEESESRLDIARQIKDERPQTVVLTLIRQENEDVLLRVVRAGFCGYVSMNVAPEQLVAAIRAALMGLTPINRELAMKLLRRLAVEEGEPLGKPYIEPVSATAWGAVDAPLTPRELEVLAHVAQGKSNREVSKELHLSLSTVKTHLEHIFFKLEVNDRAQAVLKAAELDLLREPRLHPI